LQLAASGSMHNAPPIPTGPAVAQRIILNYCFCLLIRQ